MCLSVEPEVMRVTPVVPIRHRSLLYKCAGVGASQTAQKGEELEHDLAVTGE